MASEALRARLIAPLFASSVLGDLARRGHSPLLSAVVQESADLLSTAGLTYSEFFERCYAVMWRHYRSEYVYKNAIANKILLGRHSLRTTRFFTEFRVDVCKADVVLVNGTSTCYEIKTELDDLGRLAVQLESYTRVFDLTYVVTFAACADRLLEATTSKIGVLVLTDDYTFKTRREARSNRANVVPASIFDSLRRNEYLEVLREVLGEVPDVPNTKIYTACRRLFCDLSPEAAHDGMVRLLRKRRLPPPVCDLAESSTPSLTASLLTTPLRAEDAVALTGVLDRELLR